MWRYFSIALLLCSTVSANSVNNLAQFVVSQLESETIENLGNELAKSIVSGLEHAPNHTSLMADLYVQIMNEIEKKYGKSIDISYILDAIDANCTDVPGTLHFTQMIREHACLNYDLSHASCMLGTTYPYSFVFMKVGDQPNDGVIIFGNVLMWTGGLMTLVPGWQMVGSGICMLGAGILAGESVKAIDVMTRQEI